MVSSTDDTLVVSKTSPKVAEDGILYVEEGQSYDEDEYETDSDDSDDTDESDCGRSNSEEENGDGNGRTEDGEEGERPSREKDIYGEENRKEENGSHEFYEARDAGRNSDDVENAGGNKILQTAARDNAEMIDMSNGTVPEKNSSNENKTAVVTNSKDNVVEDSAIKSDKSVMQRSPDDLNNVDRKEKGKMEVTKDLPTTSEKRSLLALAAEHDRVDVIKSVLQPSQSDEAATRDSSALIQLMLNNRIHEHADDSKCLYAEVDLEEVFLPPLHLAIASSSTSAACCFLRMGADPSIRPSIPLDWNGPDYRMAENMEPGLVVDDWRMFHGLSAWELAFGTSYTSGEVTETGKVDAKEGWFRWSSSPTTKNGNSTEAKNSPLNIAPSKLEGIRHAFMAEALRAIGADEVKRLSELINSGIDSASGGSVKSINNERIEVGGKDLLGWCITMNAVNCSNMLKTMYDNYSGHEDANDVIQVKDSGVESTKTEVPGKKEDGSSSQASEAKLCDLKAQLEENESLAVALSAILDDLAEEVSNLQGLLFQDGQSSNSALLSQVRSLKEARNQKEDELLAVESRLGDLQTEFRMVLMWWTNQGGTEDEILSADLDSMAQTKLNPPTSLSKNETLDMDGKRSTEKELTAQVALSENNIRKMRKKISDLADEKSRGIVLVEEMGLTGAIRLSQTLREEILETEYALENAKRLGTEYYARIRLVRGRLENKTNELCSTQEAQVMERTTMEDTSPGVENNQQDEIERTHSTPMNGSLQSIDLQIDEEMEPTEVELSDEHTRGSIDTNESNEDIRPSEAVAKGASTAISLHVDGHKNHLSINIWNLILRIVSLGRISFQQAVSTTVEETYSHVMIV